ncbi:MAG: hypothetical protein PVF22_07310, partial [Candidatus Aminicenantes bacterium]
MKRKFGTFLILFCVVSACVPFVFSEEDGQEIQDIQNGAPKVFLDCRRCDKDYIRTEIPFVNYVRDRKDADVHVLMTTLGTGSGGREYTMNFLGKKEYEGINSTLKYSSKSTDTSDDVRRGMVHILKAGLIPYVARTPVLNHITFDYRRKAAPMAVEDKWDFWVFHISLRGQLSGQKSYNFAQVNGNISANRITPETKLRLGLSANFNERNFKIDDETISSPSDEQNFWGQWVKSISEHWSFGGWLGANSNTFNNIKFRSYIAPALEFNVFPYAESTRRQLRFMYRVGMSLNWYREETIFDKLKETLLSESLRISWEQKEPWGNISGWLEGSHYFHDFSKNRFVFSGNISFRLFKGFSLNVNGRYSRISDQLTLPKEGASLEEILLRIKELQTNYSYSL